MKNRILGIVIGLALLSFAARAEEKQEPLKLVDGRVFLEWRITGQTSDSVYIKHSKGMAKVAKRALPEPQRSAYPFDRQLSKEEQAKEAREANERRAREFAAAQARAQERNSNQSANASRPPQAESNQQEGPTLSRAELKRKVASAANDRAYRFFKYEYEPTTTNRILSFNVDIDAQDPEPWAGIPGRYTVSGKGYLNIYDSLRSSGFSRATREFRVDLDVEGDSVKVVNFQLR